jgi:lysophospholipase L1-like esterase
LARKPHACVVYIGINDVWHKERGGGTPKATYEAGMRAIVDRMQAAGILVFLCTPSVIGEKPAGANPLDVMLDDYAEVTRGVAAHTGATLIDLRRAFQRHLEAHNPHQAVEGILTYDGVHLNAAGNRLVAQTITEQVVKVIPCKPAGGTPAQ